MAYIPVKMNEKYNAASTGLRFFFASSIDIAISKKVVPRNHEVKKRSAALPKNSISLFFILFLGCRYL
jgi:hypothetical protein